MRIPIRLSFPSYFWWLPLLLFALFMPFSARIDLQIASYLYGSEGFYKQADPRHPIYSMLFSYGEIPGWVLGIGAAAVLVLSFLYPLFWRYRRAACVITLTFLIGAGLLVNVLLKEYWGRPRPKQLVQFGGTEAFRPFYSPIWNHRTDQFKSFPSGHATMGFLFLSLGLVGRYEQKRWLYVTGMAFGVIFGSVLSYTRLIQGGHFFTDVLAAGFLMWLLAILICRVVYGVHRDFK